MSLFHSYLPWGVVLVVEGAYLRGAYRRNATRGVRCRWWQAVVTGAGRALQPGAYGRALHAGAKGRALHAGALTRALPEAPRFVPWPQARRGALNGPPTPPNPTTTQAVPFFP